MEKLSSRITSNAMERPSALTSANAESSQLALVNKVFVLFNLAKNSHLKFHQ